MSAELSAPPDNPLAHVTEITYDQLIREGHGPIQGIRAQDPNGIERQFPPIPGMRITGGSLPQQIGYIDGKFSLNFYHVDDKAPPRVVRNRQQAVEAPINPPSRQPRRLRAIVSQIGNAILRRGRQPSALREETTELPTLPPSITMMIHQPRVPQESQDISLGLFTVNAAEPLNQPEYHPVEAGYVVWQELGVDVRKAVASARVPRAREAEFTQPDPTIAALTDVTELITGGSHQGYLSVHELKQRFGNRLAPAVMKTLWDYRRAMRDPGQVGSGAALKFAELTRLCREMGISVSLPESTTITE